MLKIKTINTHKGFTKEQQKYIADVLLDFINKSDDIEQIETDFLNNKENRQHVNDLKRIIINNIPNTNFIVGIDDYVENIYSYFKKIKVQIYSDKTEKTIIKSDDLQKISNITCLYKTPDNYITDSAIALKKDTVFISDYTKIVNNDTVKISSLYNNETVLKSLKDYNKTVSKGKIIFYKNKSDYFILNKKYYDIIKDYDLYYYDLKVIAIKNNEVQSVCCCILENDGSITGDLNCIPIAADAAEKENKTYILKELIKNKKQLPAVTNQFKHYNALNNHIYSGQNAVLLNNCLIKNDYILPLWITAGQARKLKKTNKSGCSRYIN